MKYIILILGILFGLCPAFADSVEPPAIIKSLDDDSRNPLLKAMAKGEQETLDHIAVEREESHIPTPAATPSNQSDQRKEITELLDEVEKLKTKVVMTKQTSLSTQNPRSRKIVGSKTYYSYKEGDIYEVHSGVDVVTDIELQAGETLTGTPVSGDTVRWKMSVLSSGEGSDTKTHLVLKPLEENLETNLIITTDRRVYHLRAVSSDWYMPSVAWHYPDDEAKALEASIAKKESVEVVGIAPDNLNFGYRLKGGSYAWTPIRVFDDGKKTYIQMPPEIAASEAPALFVIEEDGEPQLVNYRVKGAYYIVDRLFSRAQLRVGPKLKVDILSASYEPSFWEVVFE